MWTPQQKVQCALWFWNFNQSRVYRSVIEVDFYAAKNRQHPCRKVMRHVRDPPIALALMLPEKLNSWYGFASSELRCHPLGRKLGVKITFWQLVSIHMVQQFNTSSRRMYPSTVVFTNSQPPLKEKELICF
ncbi:hypothetical protein TNCV_5137271 [Trichonephila clavipes]|nr:hypothetical protein TNCV_5137271 [Trichonephila clavipes]